MSLKKISRCGYLNNEGMINLDSILSSISANVSSANSMTHNAVTPTIPALMESMRAIDLCLNRPFHGPSIIEKLKKTNKIIFKVPDGSGKQIKIQEEISKSLRYIIDKRPHHLILLLSLIPSALGGYPTVQAMDQIMHGISDSVNMSIRELQELYPLLDVISLRLANFMTRMLEPPISGIKNSELLCQNPCGLNLIRGSRPKDLMKRMVFEYLPKIDNVINQTFLSIFTEAQESQRDLAEALHTMRPLHPRIMSSFYESTPVGVAQSITRRLESTKTLETMMMKNQDMLLKQWEISEAMEDYERSILKPRNLTDLHYVFEWNQFMSILKILNNSMADVNLINRCSTALSAELRRESWGDEVRGVTVMNPRCCLQVYDNNDCEAHENSELDIFDLNEPLKDLLIKDLLLLDFLDHSLVPEQKKR